MKKSLFVLVCLVSLFAFSNDAVAQVKVGVFEPNLVIQKSAKGKKFMNELKAFSDKKNQEIKAEFDKAEALRKEYISKQASLSAEKRTEMEKQLSDYQIRIKRMQDDAKREFSIKEQQGYKMFSDLMKPIIESIAKAKNLDLVFSRAQSGIVYMSATVDITEDIVKQIDAK
jgi:Skp family chaperone for outer membrane proteins